MRSLALALPLVALVAAPAQADATDEADDAAYGTRGSYELGGNLALTWNDTAFVAAASPSFGIFVIDLLELTVELELEYARRDDPTTGRARTAKRAALVFEPSYHPRLSDGLLLLFGVGFGLGHDADRFDLAIIPRVGVNFDLDGSGVITPAISVPISNRGGAGVFPGAVFEIGVTTTW